MLEYDRKKVGAHLRQGRERAKLTQKNAAEALGYASPQFISNIERGVSVAPLGLLAKMSKLYKSNPSKLADIILGSQEQLLKKSLRSSMPKSSS